MILISGEALIDLIPDPIRANAYDAVLGGSPFNVAIGLARLGSKTAFVSRISADGNGEALAAALAENGVDLGFVARDMRPTMLAFVMRGTAKTGSRYSFYLDATAFDGPWPFPTEWPKGARHLHVGSIAAVDPRHGQSVVAALTAARPRATISFDPNIRPLVTPDRDAATILVERQVSLAHVVKASREDLEWLYPHSPNRGHSCRLDEVRPKILCRDARGARRARHARQRTRGGRRAARRGRRHRRRRRQFHVRATVGDGSRPCARRRGACPESKRTR